MLGCVREFTNIQGGYMSQGAKILVLGKSIIEWLVGRGMVTEIDGDLYFYGAKIVENKPLPIDDEPRNSFQEKRELMLDRYLGRS